MRILVAEDDARLAAMLRRGLCADGYAVDVAADGTDALWLAGEIDYDAVVCDVVMPGATGIEVCRRLRETGRWMPVLMLTGRTAVADRIRGLDSGADDYLAKPFSFDELSARLRALVRRGTTRRPAVLSAGDLRLDPAAHIASRGDTRLELSAKEFALLELFLRHSGELLTRTKIMEHIWDFAFDPASNIVDQYVAFLRRKVDRPFGVNQLETIRSAGYRLNEQPVPAPGGVLPANQAS